MNSTSWAPAPKASSASTASARPWISQISSFARPGVASWNRSRPLARTGSGDIGASVSASGGGGTVESRSTTILSNAGPDCVVSRLVNRSVVVVPDAVNSSVSWTHPMFHTQEGLLSNAKSWAEAPVPTSRCLIAGDDAGSPEIQNVTR